MKFSAALNETLGAIRAKLEATSVGLDHERMGSEPDGIDGPGVSAVSSSAAELDFDLYITAILAGLAGKYGLDDSAALGIIYDCADELELQNQLPPYPETDSSSRAVADWMLAAKAVNFDAFVADTSAEARDALLRGARA